MNFLTASSVVGGIVGLISLLLYIPGMAVAFYYSWKCNDASGFGTVAKLIFAFIASLGSWSYLIAYLIYKWGTC